jgi:hypothetical protein
MRLPWDGARNFRLEKKQGARAVAAITVMSFVLNNAVPKAPAVTTPIVIAVPYPSQQPAAPAPPPRK